MASELPVLVGAVLGGVALVRGGSTGATCRGVALTGAGVLAAAVAFGLRQRRTGQDLGRSGVDLRFLPFLLYVANTRSSPDAANRLCAGIALIALFWCTDAAAGRHRAESGGAATSDRLSGIFGADNLKLGGVLAVLAPFVLVQAWRRGGQAADAGRGAVAGGHPAGRARAAMVRVRAGRGTGVTGTCWGADARSPRC